MRVLLAEDGDQDIGAVDFFLARRLDVQNCALNYALKSECRLGVNVFLAFDGRRVFADELRQVSAQMLDIAARRAQGIGGRWIVQQRQQQMLHGDEFMPFLPGVDKRHVQADFKFLRNHLVFLHYAGQRVLVLPCEGRYLLDLGGRDVSRIDSADAATFHMYFEHDLHRPFSVHGKKLLEHEDHEIHRREIVVEQDNRVERWGCDLAAFGFEYRAFLIRFWHGSILPRLCGCTMRRGY